MAPIAHILADDAPQMHVRPFTVAPAFSPFLLILIFGAAIYAIWYLYTAQKKIASPRIIAWLTGIRIALIVLVLMLLLRPLRQWVSTHKSPATLWVVLDQSQSMAQVDTQATSPEKLRWADSLGYLPPEMRTSRLDVLAARLASLREDTQHLQSQAATPVADNEAADQTDSFLKSVKDWNDSLNDVATELEKDPQGKNGDGATIARELHEASRTVVTDLGQAQDKKRADDASKQIDWQKLNNTLNTELTRLTQLADHVDDDFLKQHASDPKLQEALSKVAKLRRADLAYAAVTDPSHHGLKSMADVLGKESVKVIAFAGGQEVVPTADAQQIPKAMKTALEPTGTSTDLADALKFVGDQIGEGEKASVLVVSDGRANDGGDLQEPSRRLANQGARIFTLTVGSKQQVIDAAVESVDAPDWIFHDDTLRASALLRLDGLAGQACKVEFLRDGKPVIGPDGQPQVQTITPVGVHDMRVVTFKDKPPEPKLYEYEVRIADMPGDALKENNHENIRVSVKKDKLHALIVEDQPRWEYRYLANYLSRDNRVQLQTVLLEPARIADVNPPTPVKASATNTTSIEAQILPETKADWAGFDMIVLGDVPVESLSPEQQNNIAAAVKDRGTTLLVIAGPLNMPGRYAGTPLAELLPVYLAANWSASSLADQLHNGFKPAIAPEGAGSILSQFGLDETTNGDLWAAIPAWYWHSEQTQAKLSANVIWSVADMHPREGASADSASLASARNRSLLTTMSVGLGRVMYLASDSTWRLRQVSGENLHERFWGQVIRWVVGNDLPAGGKLVRFGTNKPRYVGGEPILVTAHVLKGEDLTPLAGQTFKVVAHTAGSSGEAGKQIGEAEMIDSPGTPGFYHARLQNLPPGAIELSLEGAQIDKLMAADTTVTNKTLAIDVSATSTEEMHNINSDPATMARIAQAGGGIAANGPYYDVLAEHIPNLRHDRTSVEQVGLFMDPNDPWTRKAHWIFLIAFVGLITAEWIIRKIGGMV